MITQENLNSDFIWWVHQFKHKASRTEGPTDKQADAYTDKLHRLPKPSNYHAYLELNITDTKQCQPVKANRFNVWNIMTTAPVRTIILDGLGSDLVASEGLIMGE